MVKKKKSEKVSVPVFSKKIGINHATVYKWISKGILPFTIDKATKKINKDFVELLNLYKKYILKNENIPKEEVSIKEVKTNDESLVKEIEQIKAINETIELEYKYLFNELEKVRSKNNLFEKEKYELTKKVKETKNYVPHIYSAIGIISAILCILFLIYNIYTVAHK